MTILVDRPIWPFRGERWSHLVSDTSLEELHDFAGALGIPRGAFQGDHYDIPERLLEPAIRAGAQLVDPRVIVRSLRAAGLRRRPGPRTGRHEPGGHGTLEVVSRTDQIHLELPAVPAYGRVMRIAAAHLALRRGFSLHEIDDLRLAMDEAAVLLLGPDVEGDRVEITYAVDGGRLGIEACVNGPGARPLSPAAVDRFAQIVAELVDDHGVDAAERRVTVTKHHR